MKETIEHNNRFYGEELKTESEQYKEWLVIANKEIERLHSIIKEVREIVKHEKDELDEFKGVDLLINTYQQVFGIMLEILDKV